MRPGDTNFSNPLFEEMVRYPVRFAHPVFVGQSPHASDDAVIANGTGVLVRLRDKLVAVTCHHVLSAFRARRETDPDAVFSFGRLCIDAERLLISESSSLDLATFDLTALEERLAEVGRIVEPIRWPPGEIAEDDVLAYAGFPGVWREQPSRGGLRFYSFSSGTAAVESMSPTHIVTRLEMERCLIAGRTELADLVHFGGLSGGPVFVWRKGLIVHTELVGFVTEYHAGFDLLYIRRAACLGCDGKLILEPTSN